jgi:transcription termination/antitermination protein NusA
MIRIKYDNTLMKFISLFETLTGTSVKDCIDTEVMTFIVAENHIAQAIGKNGSNVRRVEHILNRKIKIVEFNPNVLKFIANYIYPIKAIEIKEENGVVFIKGSDTKDKGLLIGRDAKNLKTLQSVVQRHFNITEIKIV